MNYVRKECELDCLLDNWLDCFCCEDSGLYAGLFTELWNVFCDEVSREILPEGRKCTVKSQETLLIGWKCAVLF